MRVDQSGKHRIAGCVEHLRGGSAQGHRSRGRAHIGKASRAYGKSFWRFVPAVNGVNRAADDDQIGASLNGTNGGWRSSCREQSSQESLALHSSAIRRREIGCIAAFKRDARIEKRTSQSKLTPMSASALLV